MVEEVTDLAKDPRPTLRGASDHHRVRAGMLEHVARHFRRVDISVRRHGDAHGLLHRAYGVVLHGADEGALARAAVDRQGSDPRVLGDVGDAHGVAVLSVPASAYFQRHRHVDGSDHALDDSTDQRFVLQERRPGGDVADLLRRTPHVDIDDLGAPIDVVASRVGHLRGIGTRDLHDDGLDLSFVIRAPQRLACIPKLRIGGNHLGNGETGTQPLAQLAERTIGDTGHRRDDEIAQNAMRADLHCESLKRICDERERIIPSLRRGGQRVRRFIFLQSDCCKRASIACVDSSATRFALGSCVQRPQRSP